MSPRAATGIAETSGPFARNDRSRPQTHFGFVAGDQAGQKAFVYLIVIGAGALFLARLWSTTRVISPPSRDRGYNRSHKRAEMSADSARSSAFATWTAVAA